MPMSTESVVRGHPSCLFEVEPIEAKTFGARVRFTVQKSLREVVDALHLQPRELLDVFHAAGGLLVLSQLHDIAANPRLLASISQLFGTEVENYHQTLKPANRIHPDVDEVLVLINLPPVALQPPPKPQPERTPDGSLRLCHCYLNRAKLDYANGFSGVASQRPGI